MTLGAPGMDAMKEVIAINKEYLKEEWELQPGILKQPLEKQVL